MSFFHQPVLLFEVIDFLQPKSNEHFVDLTIGGGGHAEVLLQKNGPDGKIYGFDLDPAALKASRERLKKFENRVVLFRRNFSDLIDVFASFPSFPPLNGIVLDLGISSFQLMDQSRGFSFQKAGYLNMSFSGQSDFSAADILNTWSEDELFSLLKNYGEERFARPIARSIVIQRKDRAFETTEQLVNILERVYRGKPKPRHIHFATKTFQALRIAVNQELKNLQKVLPQMVSVIRPGGRIAVISFHSLEDRIVKEFFRKESMDCICPPQFPECRCRHKRQIRIITKKTVRPSHEEILSNSRSRSARLRVVEKLPLAE